jgi:LmbE family N-acetylglucosaminyl deacetylase
VKLPDRILFVGAHCDDVELFAGGLLARACRSRRQVGVLVFSDHRGVVDDRTADRARDELARNLEWLGQTTGARIAHHGDDLWLPACRGAFEAERGAIYGALEALRDGYDVVVTHAPGDTNQDHAQVAAEARRVFKAHATVLGGEFPANDVGAFTPRVLIPLEAEDVAMKVELVARYESQRLTHRPYFDEDVIRGLARVRGSQIHAAAAEAFDIVTRVVMEP